MNTNTPLAILLFLIYLLTGLTLFVSHRSTAPAGTPTAEARILLACIVQLLVTYPDLDANVSQVILGACLLFHTICTVVQLRLQLDSVQPAIFFLGPYAHMLLACAIIVQLSKEGVFIPLVILYQLAVLGVIVFIGRSK